MGPSKPVLVSVCIPCYNSANFIAETLQSVIHQTYNDLEIIITDGGSTDNTREIVQGFSDPRIKYHRYEENYGIEYNWNKALSLANGKYIKLVCDDDILYPDCVQIQVEILENPDYEGVVLVTGNKYIINEQGKVLFTRSFPGKKGYLEGKHAVRKSLKYGTNIIGEPAAGLFRRNILDKTGLSNAENLYLLDLDFWSRVLLEGDLFVVDKVLYGFRISSQSLSADLGLKQISLFNAFADRIYHDTRFGFTSCERIVSRIMSIIIGLTRNMIFISIRKAT